MSNYFIDSKKMMEKLKYGNKRLQSMVEDLGIMYQYCMPWPEEAKEGFNEAYAGLEYARSTLEDLAKTVKKEINCEI